MKKITGASIQKKVGVTKHPSELSLRKVNATATIPLFAEISSLGHAHTLHSIVLQQGLLTRVTTETDFIFILKNVQ